VVLCGEIVWREGSDERPLRAAGLTADSRTATNNGASNSYAHTTISRTPVKAPCCLAPAGQAELHGRCGVGTTHAGRDDRVPNRRVRRGGLNGRGRTGQRPLNQVGGPHA
jgi:hypothetical protein